MSSGGPGKGKRSMGTLQHPTIEAAPPITLATLQAGERVTVQVRPIASDSAAAVWIGTIRADENLGLRLHAEARRVDRHEDPESSIWCWPGAE